MYTVRSLHGILEGSNCLTVRDQSCSLRGYRIALHEIAAYIALDAARIVAVPILAWVPWWASVAQRSQGTIEVNNAIIK
jgi:hypothetical protein